MTHELLPQNGSVVMFMIVRRPNGAATGYPMTGRLREGELEITTYRKAAKARYLLADDRVCCVVADPAVEGAGVALYGRARPAPPSGFLANTEDDAGWGDAITVPDTVRETVRERLESDKRMVFRIEIERVADVGAR